MKLTRIFGMVLALHFAVVGALLVQPGCQTSKAGSSARSTAAGTTNQTGVQPVDNAFNAGVGVRQAPTRPLPVDEPGAGEMLEQPAPKPEPTLYTVVKGDSLGKIAKKHGVTLQALLNENHLTRDSVIRPGQELMIPAPEVSAAPLPTPEEVPGLRYVVKRGDALSKIARNYGVTVAQIKDANDLTGDVIAVGQVLVIPGASAVLPPQPAPVPPANIPAASGMTYTVQAGDMLANIARRHGVKVNDLMALNGISDPRKLRAGQTLKLPAGAHAPTAAPARAEQINNIPPAPAPAAPAAPITITPDGGSTPPPAPDTDLEQLGDEPETPTLQIESEDDAGNSEF